LALHASVCLRPCTRPLASFCEVVLSSCNEGRSPPSDRLDSAILARHHTCPLTAPRGRTTMVKGGRRAPGGEAVRRETSR